MERSRRRRWNSDKIESAENKWTGEANIRHAQKFGGQMISRSLPTGLVPASTLNSVDAFDQMRKPKWKAKIPEGFAFKIGILESQSKKLGNLGERGDAIIESSHCWSSIVGGGCRKFWATRAGAAGLRVQIGGT